jgi:uncharacterized protein YpmB
VYVLIIRFFEIIVIIIIIIIIAASAATTAAMKVAARELAKYKLDLVTVQEIRSVNGDSQQVIIHFSMEMELLIIT